MIGKLFTGIACAALMLVPPLAAQEAEPDAEAFSAMMEMLRAEPLTAEQEARLPLAQAIVDRVIPPGTLGEMMGSMFDQFMGPIMQLANRAPSGDLARQLAIDPNELTLGDEQLAEAVDILDPVRLERNERMASVMPKLMGRMMDAMEPAMREAMAEAYAVHFSDGELADIDAFFSTESGLAYARKSFAISSDPRIIAASMESMPALMGSIGEMRQEMEAAVADLPQQRRFDDLSAAERTRLAELLGWSVEELEASMRTAEELESEEEEASAGW